MRVLLPFGPQTERRHLSSSLVSPHEIQGSHDPNVMSDPSPPPWDLAYAAVPLLLPGTAAQEFRAKRPTDMSGPSPPPWDLSYAAAPLLLPGAAAPEFRASRSEQHVGSLSSSLGSCISGGASPPPWHRRIRIPGRTTRPICQAPLLLPGVFQWQRRLSSSLAPLPKPVSGPLSSSLGFRSLSPRCTASRAFFCALVRP